MAFQLMYAQARQDKRPQSRASSGSDTRGVSRFAEPMMNWGEAHRTWSGSSRHGKAPLPPNAINYGRGDHCR